jgi:AraC-like DNA-binding protein
MEARKKISQQELSLLNEYLSGTITDKNAIPYLELSAEIGSGQIHCVTMDRGLMAMEFDLTLGQDQEVVLGPDNSNCAYLFYCLKGNCFHKFKGRAQVTKFEELQTVVLFNDRDHRSKFLFKKEERVVLNCIKIDFDIYKDDTIESGRGLIALLNSYNKRLGYFHYGKFNLEIGELIKQLENAKFVDSVSSLIHFHGLCHIILAKQLEQFKKDIQQGISPSTSLLKRELETISDISDFIRNYPEMPHSISSISSKSGLSPSKLQLGFKFMHAKTLGEYIRMVRLEKAEELIRTTDLNISQVVYSIGFTSRSYFCKIFKKKYGCSPKVYKRKTNEALQIVN